MSNIINIDVDNKDLLLSINEELAQNPNSLDLPIVQKLLLLVNHMYQELQVVKAENARLSYKLDKTETALKHCQTMLFGRRSEKLNDDLDELPLFDAMDCSIESDKLENTDSITEQSSIKCEEKESSTKRTRSKNVDKFLDSNLPREIEYIRDYDAEAKGMVPINYEESMKLACKSNFYIRVIRRYVYAYPDVTKPGIVTAPADEHGLFSQSGRSQFDNSFVANLIYSKFQMGISTYRYQESCACQGISINYSTLTYLIKRSAEILKPIYNLILDRFDESCDIAHGDETFIRLVHPGVSKKAVMWVKSAAQGCGPPYVIFQFAKDRKAENALKLHSENCKYLLKDGYDGYNILTFQHDTVLCACWAHVRRKFYQIDQGGTMSRPYLELIRDMYLQEKRALDNVVQAENNSDEVLWRYREKYRAAYTKELVKKFFALCEQYIEETPVLKDELGKAISYALNYKEQLMQFLNNPKIPIDNNPIEREIRRFVIGRRNWLFIGSETSGQNTAIHLTLMMSCLNSKVNYLKYLQDVLNKVSITPKDQLEKLLPDQWEDDKTCTSQKNVDPIFDVNHKVTAKELRDYIKNNK